MGPRILVLNKHHSGKRMASPGIRSYHIARVLAEQVPGALVTMATPSADELRAGGAPFATVPYRPQAIMAAARESDVLIASRVPLHLLPVLNNKRIVLDMFTPFITEWIEVATSGTAVHQDVFLAAQSRDLMVQLLLADLILAATRRQRDLYFGMLTAVGRIMPDAYDHDRNLENMLGIAPYGVRPGEAAHTRCVLRGVWPGIERDDTVLIWNGAIVEWYDIETLIRAVHQVSQLRPDVKLFFMGTEHPDNPGVKKLHGLGGGAARAALRLCEELGVLDRHVFFNFDWVDYDDTANFLLEADAGVCTYYDNIETRYAFRSRLPDLLWAELPIICTQGDAWAELVEAKPLGVAVPERNQEALVNAIMRIAEDKPFVEQCKAHLRVEKESQRWERTLQGLVDYCQRPARPSKRLRRAWPIATTLAASFESKARLGVHRRLDKIQQTIKERLGRR
jgi:glycosyltransferase involved in cell wall biosynthesis